jgi:uncharacterized membrane protein YiaA
MGANNSIWVVGTLHGGLAEGVLLLPHSKMADIGGVCSVFGGRKEVKSGCGSEQTSLSVSGQKSNERGYAMKNQPSLAFVFVSWSALFAGALAFLIGLWNADIMLNEKGTFFTLLMFGLFAAVSVQKSVRDREEGIPVTDTYYGISWVAAIMAVLLLTIGLWGATMTLSEKGFYAMAYALSMFAAITVQKNTRDRAKP